MTTSITPMTSTSVTAPTAHLLDQRLREVLHPSALEVIDESGQHNGHAGANGSGFGTHFRVRVTSHLFTGKSIVVRHRLVYDALHDFMAGGLHALAIEAQAPTV
jgi:BolA protein